MDFLLQKQITVLAVTAMLTASCSELVDGTKPQLTPPIGGGSSTTSGGPPSDTASFDNATGSGDESVAAVNIPVSLSAAPTSTVTVDYAVTGGTATGGGVDYTLAAGQLTYLAGIQTQNIPLTVVEDALSEAPETVIITISNPTGGFVVGTPSSHTYTITDNDPLPTIAFDLAVSNDLENVSPALLDVSLSTISGQNVTVDYTVTGGTATGGGTDYTLAAGTLTITAGNASDSISMVVIDDALDEFSETVQVTLSNPSGATLGGITAHTYTIDDNDPLPSVEFAAASSSGSEAATPALMAVNLSTVSGKTVTVDYSVTGGTATGGGTDYTLAAGTLTFIPGVTSQDVSAAIVDDALLEANETIVVTLASPSEATLGAQTTHTYTIVDNDVTVDYTVAAANNGEGVSPVTVSVDLSAASTNTVTVDYAVTGGTATGGSTDYTLASGTLTFVPTDVNETFDITIVNDALDEDNETIIVTLSNPVNATLGATNPYTYTINDDDPMPTVAYDLASSNGLESVTPANLAVSLSAVSGRDVDVDYAVTGGTATGGGTDFTLAAGTVTFLAGETTKNIAVAIVDDALPEANETIEVTLSSPVNATLGATTLHTYTINDNDPFPDCDFNLANSNGDESANGSPEVVLSTASGETVTVDYSVTGGTATGGGVDYTLAAGTLTFTPSDTSENISLTVVNDLIDENDETVVITLANPDKCILSGQLTHTYTINDNDAPPTVQYNLASSNGDESVTPANIEATLSASSGKTVTVDYSVTGGTATGGGTDYTLAAGTLTFTPGDTSEMVQPAIVDDALVEGDETIILDISNPGNATLGGQTSHTYTINDNEIKVGFDVGSSNGGEATSPANLSVSLTAASASVVTVDYAVTGGTATGGGVDYTLASGTLTFVAFDTNELIPITVNSDALDEFNETIIVTLSNPTNASLDTITAHTYTINDDDPLPTVAFNAATASVNESGGSVNIPVDLNTASGKTVTVDYAVTGGTATGGGTDYTLASGTLTFNPGVTTQNITPSIVDERIREAGGETVLITLSNPSEATLGGITVNTLTINDDPIASGLAWMFGTQTTNSTDLNQNTAYPLRWDTSDLDATYFTHPGGNPERLQIAAAGDYFLAFTVPMTGASNRTIVQMEVRVNGTPIQGGIGQGTYIRNADGHNESSAHAALLLDGLAVNDYIEVFARRVGSAGTVTVTGQASLYAEYVAPARTVFTATTTQTTNGTNLNNNTEYAYEWTEIVKDVGFTHSNVTNPEDITLDNAGDYAVFVNIPVDGGAARGNVRVRVLINGGEVAGGQAQSYSRGTQGGEASMHWSGMIYNTTAGDVLTITAQREASAGTINVLAGQSGSIFVEQLSTGSNTFFSHSTGLIGGADWNPTASDDAQWTVDDIIDTGVFTHSVAVNSHQITLDQAGDYLIVYNDTFNSIVARSNPQITVSVNGTPETGAEVKSHMIRAGSGHDESSGSLVFLMRDMVAGDVITVNAIAEAANGAVNQNADSIILVIKK